MLFLQYFFRKLPSVIPNIPLPVAVRKLLPQLASALEFGGAPHSALTSLLLIAKSIDGEEASRRVVPCLAKLFASTDRSLRRGLLENLEQYAPYLSTPVVEEQIFPQLASGFSDTNGYIRELTLKSVLTLAPLLTNRTLTQGVLKHLSKLQARLAFMYLHALNFENINRSSICLHVPVMAAICKTSQA